MRRPRYRCFVASAALALLLTACGRQDAADLAESGPGADASGYLSPPQVLAAHRGADGTVVIFGRSGPLMRVRLSTPPPTSTAYGGTAGTKGDWSVAVPAASDVRLYGVAEELVGRDVQGEGYVAALPGPGPAGAVLRAGGGAQVLARPSGLKIAALDYDSSGAAVISGLARSGVTARLFVDGVAAGEARTNDRGRFSVNLGALKPGDHEARVDAADQSVSVKFTVGAPAPVAGLPYRGQRTPVGWRIDWLTPGGGEQTTQIFDAAES
jgi:hypothetical protein